MKKIFLLAVCLIGSYVATQAQLKDPVSWNFEATKKTADTYEVIITANFSRPWHVYSQSTPEGGPIPTKITFNTNPLVKLEGKTKETGKLEKINDKIFGVPVHFYSDKIVYAQLVKVKAGVKTNISGFVKYMACDDKECTPPTKKTFDIKLQ
jgi:hypothetical protein